MCSCIDIDPSSFALARRCKQLRQSDVPRPPLAPHGSVASPSCETPPRLPPRVAPLVRLAANALQAGGCQRPQRAEPPSLLPSAAADVRSSAATRSEGELRSGVCPLAVSGSARCRAGTRRSCSGQDKERCGVPTTAQCTHRSHKILHLLQCQHCPCAVEGKTLLARARGRERVMSFLKDITRYLLPYLSPLTRRLK